MTEEVDRIADIEDEVYALELTLGSARNNAQGFEVELTGIKSALTEAGTSAKSLNSSISNNLRRAFDALIFDGAKLSDVLKSAFSSITRTAYRQAVSPVFNHLGGLFGNLFGGAFADGGAFSQGRVMPFANGGIVNGPTTFPMRGGTGLMGEAGPEAIMPLERGPDGRLGVAARGGASVHVTMNITTPDVGGFEKSRSQIAAQMSRALAAGRRNR
ncbi:MAG: phage tail tape measure protein [Pseudomonadota bacterium]